MATKKMADNKIQQIASPLTPSDLNLNEQQKADVSKKGFSQYIRVLKQNGRQGTVGCKDRSEVSFSNKKPWKQKGTGRARAGSARSPLWRKGGVVFGPQQRTRKLSISKQLKQKVCNNLLWQFLLNNRIINLQWTTQANNYKTSEAYKALELAGLHNKKVVFFVNEADIATHLSFANIANINMLLFDQPNAYDLANGEYWMVLNKDMDAFKEMVNRWI